MRLINEKYARPRIIAENNKITETNNNAMPVKNVVSPASLIISESTSSANSQENVEENVENVDSKIGMCINLNIGKQFLLLLPLFLIK